MASFTLDGTNHEYLLPDPDQSEKTMSWEYGKWPKVAATVALQDGGTLEVYARAERWKRSHTLVRWEDDYRRPHHAWVPVGKVRRVTDSEWDIWEYHRCPENLRGVRWGNRLPGFLPA